VWGTDPATPSALQETQETHPSQGAGTAVAGAGALSADTILRMISGAAMNGASHRTAPPVQSVAPPTKAALKQAKLG